MDDDPLQRVLRSIAISSGFIPITNEQERRLAFQALKDFKQYDGKMSVCIAWLHQECITLGGIDVTLPVKLFSLNSIQDFLQTSSYVTLSETERLQLRHAILTSARQVSSSTTENRALGNKLASILAALMIRDFPQRWMTFFQDVFSPMRSGGLWCNEPGEGFHTMGVKICLECLRLVAEDTTDSDFNTKVPSTRRNDILLGLNEVSSQFLPLLFSVLEHYGFLVQSKSTLNNMRIYLHSQGRKITQLTQDELIMYQIEKDRLSKAISLIQDCLATLAHFCSTMPLDWTFANTPDFVGALLHMLREPYVQVEVLKCLENLAQRKLDGSQWIYLIRQLPIAVSEANSGWNQAREEQLLEQQVSGNFSNQKDSLALQLPYHRALSRMLALTVSTNVSHITTDKNLMNGKSSKRKDLSTFLRILVDLLHHPSGRVCAEQINTWTILLRDPGIASSTIISPFAKEIMMCYMDHNNKIRWEDVENSCHQMTELMEASWDDEDEYESWLCDFRSRCTQLFKSLACIEPQIISSVLYERVHLVLQQHGDGAPHDHLHTNNQLTPRSDAVMKLEALIQPVETALSGIPKWAMKDADNHQSRDREAIRSAVTGCLVQLSNAIVTWNPTHIWLKFRRVQLLESMKHFWIHQPTNLLQAVDALLGYLGARDDWSPGHGEPSGEVISLRKKSGVSLVAVAKKVPHHLVLYISPLSEAVRRYLSSSILDPSNRMHLYEFLSCVATAIKDPVIRANFISDVLSDAISVLESPSLKQSMSSLEEFQNWLGISEAANNPSRVSDPEYVQQVTSNFVRVFSAISEILSVGKRCNDAKRRQVGLLPFNVPKGSNYEINFPDEGPVSLQDLALEDPFVPLWPRILPALLQIIDVLLQLWHPIIQAKLLPHNLQRYVYAISDDEAFLSRVHDTKSGGVFGEGGTAGSVVAGVDRRQLNLLPRWSGWFNELRNACFQMLGLLSGQRALFAPELASLYPRFVSIVANPEHFRSMENRQLTQYLKQFIEILILSCPVPLYSTHLAPIITPLFAHIEYRLEKNWHPVVNPSAEHLKRPLTSADCQLAGTLAAACNEKWFSLFYARSGVFVGDLDLVTAEAVVDKCRVELSRTYSDVIQAALALKGDWALVLANFAKEEGAIKKNDPSLLMVGPRNQIGSSDVIVNADGTPKQENQSAIDSRKLLRINKVCEFFLLENEQISYPFLLATIRCLNYPDAYTVRRCTKICHRILETVAWSPKFTPLIANYMFTAAVTNIVTEPKWMVGIEWDMINVVRDIYCRLVLGQVLQFGGQGPAQQQPDDISGTGQFEQAKTLREPLKGGGILTTPTTLPRELLARLPDISENAVMTFEENMKRKRSAKDQKDFLRDILRVAAEKSQQMDNGRVCDSLFGRADGKESLLMKSSNVGGTVSNLPEKLVTQSMVKKREQNVINDSMDAPAGLAAFAL